MRLCLLLLACALAAHGAMAMEYNGKVIGIADGDTLTMRTGNNHRMTIRLAEIDAPEKKQPYGEESKRALILLAQGQHVCVHKVTVDKYGRTVGTVYRRADGLNINQQLVRDGDAWAYRQYLHDPVMSQLEDAARASETGLWALTEDSRLPPWQWRRETLENGLKAQYGQNPHKLSVWGLRRIFNVSQ